jgi:2-oxoglutarate ferredoxin oxidoreductase subunit delta
MIPDCATPERVDAEPRPRKRRLPRGEVHIFENWCKGCGLCIEFCPAGVLVLGTDNRPKAIYPEKCTACRWCELHCPDFAIFVADKPRSSDIDDVNDAAARDDRQDDPWPATADRSLPADRIRPTDTLHPVESAERELEPENT